jgi:hypothetical protein
MITDHDVVDVLADLDHHTRALLPTQNRKRRHRDITGGQMVIGMAKPRSLHPYLHLTSARIPDLDFLDRPRLVEIPDQSTLGPHRTPP